MKPRMQGTFCDMVEELYRAAERGAGTGGGSRGHGSGEGEEGRTDERWDTDGVETRETVPGGHGEVQGAGD